MEKIFKLVEKPGRYTGGEINMVEKDLDQVSTRIAFAFPDMYEIGMSYVGMQILYDILNKDKDIYCERVFAPAKDMEEIIRKENIPLFSLETKSSLADFDILAFTLQYEMSYTNVLNIMDLAGIPVLSKERSEEAPVIIAGGPCAFNPEPLADFIDVFLIGDGEDLLLNVSKLHNSCSSKKEFLEKVIEFEGVYVPSFYSVEYKEDGTIKEYKRENEKAPEKVKRAVIDSIEDISYPKKPLVPLVEITQDRAVVETFRGCTRGCRFCQAGMIYRPVRERSPERIKELVKTQLSSTGHEELSLLSLSTSDYSKFEELAVDLMSMCKECDVSLSLPSLRLDSFSFKVLSEIQSYKKSGLTFAPEAGSQRLRDIINKNITEEDILSALKQAIDLGWKKVKLYFMIGLPGETYEDLDGIADLAKKIKALSRGYFNIKISVSNFVPKPYTPFQWAAQEKDFIDKHNYLSNILKIKGVSYSYHDSFVSILEGLFARGDRRVGEILLRAFKKGCKFDSWSEFFYEEGWKEAIEESGINIDFYTTRERSFDEYLPWDIIDSGISKDFLKGEMKKALEEKTTHDCRSGCVGCGMNSRVDCQPKNQEQEVRNG